MKTLVAAVNRKKTAKSLAVSEKSSTHVSRVASRLGYVKEGTDPVKIEGILEKRFPKESHIKLHHQLIWFGREICHARKPDCPSCELGCHCLYFKKASSKTGK